MLQNNVQTCSNIFSLDGVDLPARVAFHGKRTILFNDQLVCVLRLVEHMEPITLQRWWEERIPYT